MSEKNLTEYRVITNDDKFRIEYRWLWGSIIWQKYEFWRIVKISCPPDGVWEIAEFDDERLARNKIVNLLSQEEIESRKWKVVREKNK